jgi:hypothetical protein
MALGNDIASVTASWLHSLDNGDRTLRGMDHNMTTGGLIIS